MGWYAHFENQLTSVHHSFSDLKFLLCLENIAGRTDRKANNSVSSLAFTKALRICCASQLPAHSHAVALFAESYEVALCGVELCLVRSFDKVVLNWDRLDELRFRCLWIWVYLLGWWCLYTYAAATSRRRVLTKVRPYKLRHQQRHHWIGICV